MKGTISLFNAKGELVAEGQCAADLAHEWANESQDDINCEIDIFDEMTRRGAKLNLITGEYEWPKP